MHWVGRARQRRRLALAASFLALTVLLAGCAADVGEPDAAHSQSTTGSSSGGSVAYADVAFVQSMIAHDRQTVRVCDLLLAKPSVDPSIRAVAERMRTTRSTEIDRLVAWLAGWGLDESPVDHEHGGSHGLLLPGQVLRFERADGPTAQAAFVEVMIERDAGVRAVAEPMVSAGSDEEIKKLAAGVIATGDAETSELEPLQGGR